jgi:hypothetical protein
VWPAALPTVGPSEAAGDGGVIYLAELGAYLDLQIWTLKGTAAVAAAGAAALSLELACLPMKDYVFPPVFAPQKEGDCPGLGVYAGIIGEYTHTSLGLCRAACASAAVQRPPAPNRGVSRRRLRSSGCGTMGATSLRSDKPTHPTPPPSSAAPTPQAVLGAALVDGGRDLHVLVNAGVERKGAPDPDTGAWWLRVAVGRGGGEKAPKVKKQRLLAAPDAGDRLLYAALLGAGRQGQAGSGGVYRDGGQPLPFPGFLRHPGRQAEEGRVYCGGGRGGCVRWEPAVGRLPHRPHGRGGQLLRQCGVDCEQCGWRGGSVCSVADSQAWDFGEGCVVSCHAASASAI